MYKGKEWLKEQIKHEEVDLKYAFDNYVPYEKVLIADDVNELLNQLEEPEQEKVVVNEVMAGHIENCKNLKLTLSDSLHLVVPEDKQKEVLFARAWLDGYEVEKEKRFYIRDKVRGATLMLFDLSDGGIEFVDGFSKEETLIFKEKEKAELIAKYVDGTVEEVTE